MKFKLVDSTGILRMKSVSIPVVVHDAKRDKIDVVILIRNMQKVFAIICPEFYQRDLLPFSLGYQILTKAKIR